jgi:hypothetical protein
MDQVQKPKQIVHRRQHLPDHRNVRRVAWPMNDFVA